MLSKDDADAGFSINLGWTKVAAESHWEGYYRNAGWYQGRRGEVVRFWIYLEGGANSFLID